MHQTLTERQAQFYRTENGHEHRPEGNFQNVGRNEALVSMLAGGGLTLYGISRGSVGGFCAALLGGAFLYRGWTRYCPISQQLGRNTADEKSPQAGVRAQQGNKIVKSLHVNRSRQELYDFWRSLENLPHVMSHLESVTPIDATRSRWVAHAPFGKKLAWEAEIITDKPGEVIAWRSLPGSEVDTAGSVHILDPAFGEGTELRVTLKYDPPGGRLAETVAHAFGYGLSDELEEDLRDLKSILEAGEIPTTAGQPQGRTCS